MHLTKGQAREVYEGLAYGYKPAESRLQVGKQNYRKVSEDVCQHLLAHTVPTEWHSRIPSYRDAPSGVQHLLAPYLDKAFSIVSTEVVSWQYTFLILSTSWCGKPRHVKHVHTLVQDYPQRCVTYSVPVPLYIDPESEASHKFFWHYQQSLYPKVTYTSQDRMEKVDVEYCAVDFPKQSYSSLLFDSSRAIHYIDNTPHLYLWVVCDAVVTRDGNPLPQGVALNLHGPV